MDNAVVFTGLQDFLERMREPSAGDFVKSIKSFIVSFSNEAGDPERDSAVLQRFFAKMEVDVRVHPVWAGCSEEELDSASEGLEKYVMTKLFTRVFASVPDNVRLDNILHEKMALVQKFIRPENLDIKPAFQNETSWLLAQKELQKINMYKAPRDKLVCILNCCKVINNLLHNASISSNKGTHGADEFLPVLIYVTLKANPPQLHSNLLYIQRYRRQSRLVAEAAYFFTNMLSVESFISNMDADALSMDETEFDRNMESAGAILSGLSTDLNSHSNESSQPVNINKESAASPKSTKVPSLSDLEGKGAVLLVNDEQASQVFRKYPYFFANVGDLTVDDAEDLLDNYKQLAFKFVCLSKGLGYSAPSPGKSSLQDHQHGETAKLESNTEVTEPKPSKEADTKDDGSNQKSLFDVESLESQLFQDQTVAQQDIKHEDDCSQSTILI